MHAQHYAIWHIEIAWKLLAKLLLFSMQYVIGKLHANSLLNYRKIARILACHIDAKLRDVLNYVQNCTSGFTGYIMAVVWNSTLEHMFVSASRKNKVLPKIAFRSYYIYTMETLLPFLVPGKNSQTVKSNLYFKYNGERLNFGYSNQNWHVADCLIGSPRVHNCNNLIYFFQ